ncbi:DUF1403 family protein [Agrobacterium vitis]|uniref:DUF1403 family protein n=1 Tax=Agrobacterium vitis TaxID=373 RepID=A0A6L6VNE3_AGRVI|nr:DUF1403 family protein [Agrobacterium vitis]
MVNTGLYRARDLHYGAWIRSRPPLQQLPSGRPAYRAAVAAKMLGRSEDESALRDAVQMTAAGDDPGPAGKLFLATRRQRRLNLNRTSDGSGGRLYVACGSVISRQTAIASVRSVR